MAPVGQKKGPTRASLRLWLVPMGILGGIALLIFISLYTLDHHVTGGVNDPHPASGRRAISSSSRA